MMDEKSVRAVTAPDIESKNPQSTSAEPWSLLLSLPSDIRNIIYHLVCYHGDTRGIIAPIPAIQSVPNKYRSPIIPMTIHGRERPVRLVRDKGAISRLKTYLEHDSNSVEHARSLEQTRRAHIHDYITIPESVLHTNNTLVRFSENGWTEHAVEHICTQRCLLQPTLSKVNRQLRQEVLSYFYGANIFRIVWGGYRGVERFTIQWMQAMGDHNLRLIERLEMRIHEQKCQNHLRDPFTWKDWLTIERRAGTSVWTVFCYESFIAPPLPPIGEHWICKKKGWHKLRSYYIGEVYRKDIEGANGLSMHSLEMVLLGRRWIPPSVQPTVVLDEQFRAAKLAFMTKFRARKSKKVRMLGEGEVKISTDDMLPSMKFMEMHARVEIASLRARCVPGDHQWVPKFLEWLSPVQVVAVLHDVLSGRIKWTG